jgi:hypothetical protein
MRSDLVFGTMAQKLQTTPNQLMQRSQGKMAIVNERNQLGERGLENIYETHLDNHT